MGIITDWAKENYAPATSVPPADKFGHGDFVQVEFMRAEDNKVSNYWRNALYIGMQDGNHMVRYTNGSSQVLHRDNPIRKGYTDNNEGNK